MVEQLVTYVQPLPWFKRGDYYWDVVTEELWCLTRGPEPLPASIYNFDKVAPNAESGWVRMDNRSNCDLESDKDYLFMQYFWGLTKKGYTYQQYPSGEQIFTTDKLIPTPTVPWSAYHDCDTSPFLKPSRETEFFIVKGVTAAFKYRNESIMELAQKIRFLGKKFRRDKIVQGQKHPMFNTIISEEDIKEYLKEARPLYMRRIA